MISVFCDGLCEPRNPGGWACWAWLALDDSGSLVARDYGCCARGGATNNVAEYAAVIAALRHALKQSQVGADALSRQAFAEAQAERLPIVPLLAQEVV
jgi:ribonuclease HI